MVTIKDVALRAGVAISTASLAINGKDRVSQKTRGKVLQAADELGYIPNNIAKSLMKNKTELVGLLLADIINPYHATLTHYLEKELRKNGYRIHLGISEGRDIFEKRIITDFISQKVDGVIIHAGDILDVSVNSVIELKNRNIPTVLIGGNINGIILPEVDINLEEGSYELTKYLLEKDYKKPIYITGSMKTLTFKRRVEGHKKALFERNLLFKEEDIIETTPDYEGGYEVTKKLFPERRTEIDLIMCVNDFMAFGVLKALEELKINVPLEVGVAGFDDVLFARVSKIPLTTVRIPIDIIAKKSVEYLIQIINHKNQCNSEHKFKNEKVNLELVIRDSTRK